MGKKAKKNYPIINEKEFLKEEKGTIVENKRTVVIEFTYSPDDPAYLNVDFAGHIMKTFFAGKRKQRRESRKFVRSQLCDMRHIISNLGVREPNA